MEKYTVSYYVMKFHRDLGHKIIYNWRHRQIVYLEV